MNKRIACFASGLIFLNLLVITTRAQDQTIPGKVVAPYPTIHNLAVEWFIEGDKNLNGNVSVQFREQGKPKWSRGMSLRRVPEGENRAHLNLDRQPAGYTGFKWANKHSGSIFDLKPNTAYEILLKLTDPDGGNAEKRIVARTRPVPHVTSDAKIMEIEPGSYDTLNTLSGTAAKPMVYRCAKGRAIFKFINVRNNKWVFIDGITVNNPIPGGIAIDLTGAENCAVQNCTIEAEFGIVAYGEGMTNCYISDNTLRGVYEWNERTIGAKAETTGEGIQFTGAGNVVCYNRVSGFRDCISLMEDEYAVNQICEDIYNNDIYEGADDGIEADFCFSNCRIYRNALANCYVGLSSQPGLGGPTYFIRNVMYNIIHSGFKLKRFSQGDVVLHNTLVKIGAGLGGNSAMDFAYFRNNLVISGPTHGIEWGGYSSGNPYAADIIDPGGHSSFDYDAVGVYGTAYIAKIGGRPFSEVEKHGIEQITLESTFNAVPFPDPPIPKRKVPSLQLKKGSRAIDAGVVLPNINDNFHGKAPDCGALETGDSLPHYGPRLSQLSFTLSYH